MVQASVVERRGRVWDERAARRAAHALLAEAPLLPGLRLQEVEEARARRGGDRQHGPWLALALPGAEVRLALVSARVLTFARSGLVPPGGEEALTRGRPRLPQAVLLLAAQEALARWGGAWSALGVHQRGTRRARAFFRGGSREEAELLLDAHTGAVLAVSLWRVPPATGGEVAVGREEARRLAGLARDRVQGRGLEVPEAPVLLRDPRSGSERPTWRCGTWVAHRGWPNLPCACPGERVWLLVDATSGAVAVERAERG